MNDEHRPIDGRRSKHLSTNCADDKPRTLADSPSLLTGRASSDEFALGPVTNVAVHGRAGRNSRWKADSPTTAVRLLTQVENDGAVTRRSASITSASTPSTQLRRKTIFGNFAKLRLEDSLLTGNARALPDCPASQAQEDIIYLLLLAIPERQLLPPEPRPLAARPSSNCWKSSLPVLARSSAAANQIRTGHSLTKQNTWGLQWPWPGGVCKSGRIQISELCRWWLGPVRVFCTYRVQHQSATPEPSMAGLNWPRPVNSVGWPSGAVSQRTLASRQAHPSMIKQFHSRNQQRHPLECGLWHPPLLLPLESTH